MVTTKKQIAAAAAGWHPDERCQGLALWVKPNGSRRWVLDYRFNGRQRRMTLGRAETLPADEALKLARRHRVAIDRGSDPLAEKDAARKATEAAVTLTTFFEQRYLVDYARGKKKPSSIKEDERLFHATIEPTKLGRLRVPDITDDDVRRFHRGVEAPIVANRALALLSKMMNLAEAWKLRRAYSNPTRHVIRHKERKVHRFLSSDQLMALGRVLTESERAPKTSDAYEPPVMLAAIRLLLFSGMRRGEVLGLKWDDVDLDRGLLNLSDSKTGAKTVVLPAPARVVLDALAQQRKAGVPWVFPGRDASKPLVGLPHAWTRIRKRAGLDGVRIHDLRHTFGSTGAGLGASLPVLGSLLGHTVAQTTQRYAGVAQDPRREAAERIGERLAAQLNPPTEPAQVVTLGGRRKKAARRG